MVRDQLEKEFEKLAIQIAVTSENNGIEIEDVIGFIHEHYGQPSDDLKNKVDNTVATAAHIVRDHLVKMRREFYEIAAADGYSREQADAWLRRAIDALLNEEQPMSPDDLN